MNSVVDTSKARLSIPGGETGYAPVDCYASDPVCGRCNAAFSEHYEHSKTKRICDPGFPDMVFMEKPSDRNLIAWMQDHHADLVERMIAEWRRSNGHNADLDLDAYSRPIQDLEGCTGHYKDYCGKPATQERQTFAGDRWLPVCDQHAEYHRSCGLRVRPMVAVNTEGQEK